MPHKGVARGETAVIAQMIVNGLLGGLIYVIMALGFTLIFGIMRIVNFAHGEFYMLGAVGVLVLFGNFGMNYFVAVVVAGLLTGALGVIAERVLFRSVVGEEMPGMIMSLGLSIILQSVVLLALGPEEQTVARPFSGIWRIAGAVVPWDRTVVSISAIIILVAFYIFLKFSRLGLAMQAVAQDPTTASLMGVESGIIYASAYGIACLLAGLGGALMAPIYTIGPYMGQSPMLKAFVVVVIGGLGSIPGAMLGGLLLGLTESVLATLMDSTTALIASFGVVLLVVLMRPNGLLGRTVR